MACRAITCRCTGDTCNACGQEKSPRPRSCQVTYEAMCVGVQGVARARRSGESAMLVGCCRGPHAKGVCRVHAAAMTAPVLPRRASHRPHPHRAGVCTRALGPWRGLRPAEAAAFAARAQGRGRPSPHRGVACRATDTARARRLRAARRRDARRITDNLQHKFSFPQLLRVIQGTEYVGTAP